jgi:hypothetical protein
VKYSGEARQRSGVTMTWSYDRRGSEVWIRVVGEFISKSYPAA